MECSFTSIDRLIVCFFCVCLFVHLWCLFCHSFILFVLLWWSPQGSETSQQIKHQVWRIDIKTTTTTTTNTSLPSSSSEDSMLLESEWLQDFKTPSHSNNDSFNLHSNSISYSWLLCLSLTADFLFRYSQSVLFCCFSICDPSFHQLRIDSIFHHHFTFAWCVYRINVHFTFEWTVS